MDIKKSILLVGVAVVTFCLQLSAQDYEDDIYYDASKSKNSTVKKSASGSLASSSRSNSSTGSSSVSNSTPGVLVRDVDEYNRRGYYAVTDTIVEEVVGDTISDNVEDFEYTRRIERFYNPTVVAGTDDDQLREYYYETEPTTEVNIVLNYPGYWDAWYPYSGWSLYWTSSPWYWNSWYSPFYDFYWSWNSWWSPLWHHPHHHYHPAHAPAGPHHATPMRHSRYNGPGRNGVTPSHKGYRSGNAPRHSASKDAPASAPSGSKKSRPATTRSDKGSASHDNGKSSGHDKSSGSNGYRKSDSNHNNSSSYSRPSGRSSSRGSAGGGRSGGGSRGGGGRGGRH